MPSDRRDHSGGRARRRPRPEADTGSGTEERGPGVKAFAGRSLAEHPLPQVSEHPAHELRRPLKVLMVHRGLTSLDGEAAEVQQQVLGLLTADLGPHRCEVYVSDCRYVYRAVLHGQEVRYCRLTTLFRSRIRFDVAHVHMPVPAVHVVTAVLLRLRRVPVVLSPMGMLGDDYARSTWYRGRPTLFARLKPSVVRLLRALWTVLADRFVGLGGDEVRLSGLPTSRSAVVPWPAPSTGLALAVTTDDDTVSGTGGPLAFIGRFDPQRKGIDRLADWLRVRADELPRPAAILFASADARDAAFLDDVVQEGLLEWDPRTTGGDLRRRLQDCRGVVMLSRWEAQARIMREAALLGLPIITTDTGNVREVAEYLGNVVLVDGDDPDAIQRAFDEVDELSREGKRARQLFAPENVGIFSFALLNAVATGAPWTRADYYRWLGESS